jgi:hypothetical protein
VLRNAGVGPALIDDVRIRYQGREIVSDPYDFYIGLRQDSSKGALSVDKVMPGRLIPAGEGVRMLGTNGAERGLMLGELLRVFEISEVPRAWLANLGLSPSAADRAVIEITYSSVYGERWRVRSDRIVPERL